MSGFGQISQSLSLVSAGSVDGIVAHDTAMPSGSSTLGRNLDIPNNARTSPIPQFLLITQMIPSEPSTHIQLYGSALFPLQSAKTKDGRGTYHSTLTIRKRSDQMLASRG